MSRKPLLCVGICTIMRPRMLRRCLDSLAAQRGVDDFDVRVVVVDNDREPTSKPIVDGFAPTSPFPVQYIHEPRRGIPMARNRVLDAALELHADRVAFLDDDQAALPGFLANHVAAAERDRADAVQPFIVWTYPEPAPFWSLGQNRTPQESDSDGPLEARLQTAAGTCGVMLSSRLIRPDGMGLRFNEALALAGGEDAEFFGSAYKKGARIVFSRMPVVVEEVPASRLTYRRYVLRGLARGGQLFGQYRVQNGYGRAVSKYAAVSIIRIIRGLGQLAVSPLLAPFGMRRFKFTALEGGRNVFLGAGALGGAFFLQYEYYRRIDGY